MSAGGSIAAMISSMKSNNRRKNKHKPFSKYKNEYSKGKAISSKEMTPQEKEEFLLTLKKNRELESKQKVYKLIITLGATILVITGFVFTIKLIFF